MKKGKYIIDVTYLVHWQGRLTGIPRVVQELALRFEREGREVVYASWVKELNDMCEVDLRATLAIRGRGIEYISTANTSKASEAHQPAATIEGRPLSLARRSKDFTKRVLRKTGLENHDVVTRLRKRLYDKNLSTYKRVQVSDGDIFFIAAGEWWDNNFIALIESYHSNGVKIVQVSHDVLPMVTPQFAGHATDSLSTYNSRVMPISALVLAVSEATKRDLTKWLKDNKLKVPRIEVFRVGEDFQIGKPKKPTEKEFTDIKIGKEGYILCVGTIEARKNHALLYYTYKLAKARGIKLPKLLIVGRRGWKTENIYDYITEDPEIKEDIIPLLNIGDEELSWLYDHCLFSIYPSLYEGWGMPIAESITRGAPCLASNTSSMIEVAPGFADYFTPTSTDDCLDGIINMLRPGELEKKRKLLKQYTPTTWDDSFEQVEELMEKI